MTYAELLRKHAADATNEGGMWFSGEYMTMLASMAESVEAENEKLREDLEFERSENGWAREFLNRMAEHCGTKDCPSLVTYVEKLESENVKLREWASKYAEIANYFCEREGYCSHDFVPQCRYFKSRQCKLGELNDALRELGIEVAE